LITQSLSYLGQPQIISKARNSHQNAWFNVLRWLYSAENSAYAWGLWRFASDYRAFSSRRYGRQKSEWDGYWGLRAEIIALVRTPSDYEVEQVNIRQFDLFNATADLAAATDGDEAVICAIGGSAGGKPWHGGKNSKNPADNIARRRYTRGRPWCRVIQHSWFSRGIQTPSTSHGASGYLSWIKTSPLQHWRR